MTFPSLYKTRYNYWSCSKLAEWVLDKIDNPTLQSTIEDSFDRLQDIIMFPVDVIDAIRVYFRNRFVSKSHTLQTRLPKGTYHENDTRLLHGAFELLVDFVEVEKSNMLHWSTDRRDQPWWHNTRLLRWGEYRSRQDGLEYVTWEMKLVHQDGVHLTNQAIIAKEVYELYTWWKDIRPARPDAYEVTGWSDWCDEQDRLTDGKYSQNIFGDDPDPIKTSKLLDEVRRIEAEYENEDSQMLIRLVKIRKGLWT